MFKSTTVLDRWIGVDGKIGLFLFFGAVTSDQPLPELIRCTHSSFLSVFLLDTFWINPQFRLKLHGDFSENANDKNIFVSVTQKPDKRRRQKCRKFHIGFSVFEVSLTYGCGPTPFSPKRWVHTGSFSHWLWCLTSRQDSGPGSQLFAPLT